MKLKQAFFIGGNLILIGIGTAWIGVVLLNQPAIAKQKDTDGLIDRSILSPELVQRSAMEQKHRLSTALHMKQPLVIDVSKSAHKLRVYRYGTLEKEYTVNLRAEESDRKVWEDDQTPEGSFYIEATERMDGHSWRRWMRLNTIGKARMIYTQAYPEGMYRIQKFEETNGPIDTDDDIKQFNATNPDAKMLRGVGIHGGFREEKDWTQGCVALNDQDIDELFDMVIDAPDGGLGTPVIIHD